jgi:uncharacterized protein (TIGR00369 family)
MDSRFRGNDVPAMSDAIPAGFAPIPHLGQYLSQLGPFHWRKVDDKLIVGLRIEERHTNTRGIVHGGMLVTLADSALGIVLYQSRTPPQPIVTVSLSTDFIESARPGDWVEAHVDILRIGQRLAYANCYLQVGDRRILRASGVFALMPPVNPREESEG